MQDRSRTINSLKAKISEFTEIMGCKEFDEYLQEDDLSLNRIASLEDNVKDLETEKVTSVPYKSLSLLSNPLNTIQSLRIIGLNLWLIN
jgi:hypothetical protein